MFNTPILFLIFNRPDTTKLVFEQIRKVKPKYLYVAADGPRDDIEGEAVRCNETKKIIADGIDWECEVRTLYRQNNLGCGLAVSGAITWFFQHVEEGIILEDDILPNEHFFHYCETMLGRYRYKEDIFSINGCSLGFSDSKSQYGLTRYFNMWGWAAWKRSWNLVQKIWGSFLDNPNILNDIEIKQNLKLPVLWDSREWYKYWHNVFNQTANGKIDTWDYQCVYTVIKAGIFCIRPSQNMVINIGFNEEATHTHYLNHQLSKMKYGFPFDATTYKETMPVISNEYETKFVATLWNGYKPFGRSVIGRFISMLAKMPRTVANIIRSKF
jgi:hypothetical protein